MSTVRRSNILPFTKLWHYPLKFHNSITNRRKQLNLVLLSSKFYPLQFFLWTYFTWIMNGYRANKTFTLVWKFCKRGKIKPSNGISWWLYHYLQADVRLAISLYSKYLRYFQSHGHYFVFNHLAHQMIHMLEDCLAFGCGLGFISAYTFENYLGIIKRVQSHIFMIYATIRTLNELCHSFHEVDARLKEACPEADWKAGEPMPLLECRFRGCWLNEPIFFDGSVRRRGYVPARAQGNQEVWKNRYSAQHYWLRVRMSWGEDHDAFLRFHLEGLVRVRKKEKFFL